MQLGGTGSVAAGYYGSCDSGLLGEAPDHVAEQFIDAAAKASHALQHDLNLE